MKTNARRWLAMFLCLVMTLSLLPAMAVSALADAAVPADSAAGTNDPQDVDSTVPEEDPNQDAAGADASNGEANVPPDGDQPDDVQPDDVQQDAGQPDDVQQDAGQADGANGILDDADSGIAGLLDENLPDRTALDTWEQDQNTVFGTGAVCTVGDDGRLHLKAGSSNQNNGGDALTATPAMFINSTMNEALAASEEETKTLSFDVEAAAGLENPLFGVYLNYTSGANAGDSSKKDIFGTGISVDTNGTHWFWQSYKDTAEPYADLGTSNFNVSGKNSIEIQWTSTQLTVFKVNGTNIVSSPVTLADTGSSIVAFKAGNYGNVGEFYISNLHYTGQPEPELPDAAVVDNWVQIDASKVSGSVAPTVDDDGNIVLSAASGNGNNINGDNPAIFVDTDMNKALSALEDNAERTLSFTLTPSATGSWMGFALLLRYDGTTGTGIHTYQIGYPSGETTGWFTENFGGNPYHYPGFTGPVMTANQPVNFEITWTESNGISSFKIGDTVINDLSTDYPLTSVPAIGENPDGFKGVGFKVATKNSSATTLRLSDVHYTGQDPNKQPTATYKVSGTVKDADGPISGATVTMGSKTATTDAEGKYEFARVAPGTYKMSATAKNYHTSAEATVTVSDTDVARNFTLERMNIQTIPGDGITDDVWERDTQTNKDNNTGVTCVKTGDGQVHLKAGTRDGNGHGAVGSGEASWPGVYVNKTANEALAKQTGDRFAEITFVRAEGSGPRFGVILNYTNPTDGFFVGSNTESSGYITELYKTDGTSVWQGTPSGGSTAAVGVETTLRVEWNDTKLLGVYVDGKKIISEYTMGRSDFSGKGIGFRMNTYTGEGPAEVYIKEMHYSGQAETDVYNVSGTVTDGTNPLSGVTLTSGKFTTTSAANGSYNLLLPTGVYTITATKDGYANGTATVSVETSPLTGKDIELELLPVVSGTVKDDHNNPVPEATVTLTKGSGDDAVVKTAITDQDGAYRIIGVPKGDYDVSVTAVAYKLQDGQPSTLDIQADKTQDFVLVEFLDDLHVLENDGMKVLVDQAFPRVIQYRLKGADGQLNGQRMDGQKLPINTIKINGTDATVSGITSELSEDSKTVTYTITMSEPVATVMTARLTLDNTVNEADSASKDRTLGFYIDEVRYTNGDRLTNPVKNIEIPDHCLVSVNSTQTDAKVTVAAANGNNSVKTNDATYLAANNKATNWNGAFFAAFVSNNTLSAGITSNSSLNGGLAATSNAVNRVSMVSDGENVTIGLSSVAWPYDYLLADSNPTVNGVKQDHTTALTAEQKVIDPALREQPFVKVVIAPEQNDDGKVDWQDGAIALRETVMHIPNNSQSIKDRVNTRIALNFGSQAQNPFLTSLDNAKRVALHTDGLGQAILLKGYANEGHDSGHPDYWDIGTRMGGPTDFETMLDEGKEIGAYFGIHVNAGELYAEAKALDDNIIFYRDPAQGLVKWGWHWHDTAISFKTLYDFGSGNRQRRFQQLYENGGAGLEFIYVDIWGNATGGTDDSWQTRMLANEITQQVGEGKWRIAHEWAWANPYDATFQHWTTDFTYGDYTNKGALNSAVIRFLLNEYKDSFPADFASYGGACNAPLLGGPAMQGFEGWQGDGEYDLSIYNTYNQMIPTKFLQHFGITQWTNASNAVDINYNNGGAGGSRGSTTAKWTPEVQIKLSGDKGNVVVTRGSDGNLNMTPSFATDVATETEYRSRVITLNDKVILKGAPASAGEDNTFPHSAATLKYLIPWYWNADGTEVDAADEKLYHWNAKGGESTWDLPDGWTGLATVVYYELSDQGRSEAKTLPVVNGQISFPDTIKAETGYVVVKGASNAAAPNVTYYADGQHITDPSFNDAKLSAWNKTGTVEKVNSIHGISVMKQTGVASVSQTLTGMTAGKKYIAYVAVENKSDNKAYIEVKDAGGNTLAYNYTLRSIATNYISGDALNNNHGVETGGSKMQNMYVFFTMPASGDVTLTLGHEGEGYVFFDALRIIEVTENGYGDGYGYTYDADGKITGLTQDFEHSAQGEWPFVVGPIDGVQDNMQHLSERHDKYTQSGWNIREVDDVINGNWSLKVHGEQGNGQLVYQTIPQNFRFEPGKTYLVSFNYEMGCENLMQVVIGDGVWNGVNNCQTIPLEMAKGAGAADGTGAKTCTFVITGSESGQTWFGIATAGGTFNNDGMADKDGYGLYFSGRGDFILDDLQITQSSLNMNALNEAIETASAMNPADYVLADGVTETEEAVFAALASALENARTVQADPDATQEDVDAAVAALNAAMAKLVKIVVSVSGMVTNENGSPVAGATVTLEDSNYIPVGNDVTAPGSGNDGSANTEGEERSFTWHKGLTATTDANGLYRFESTEDAFLGVDEYKVKVQAVGYNVTTVDATVTKGAPNGTGDVTLIAESKADYTNNFDDGDVSMINTFDNWIDQDGLDFGVWTTTHNGSTAAETRFRSWNDSVAPSDTGRKANNMLVKDYPIANGTISFDVTLPDSSVRFGITLRGASDSERIYIGQGSTSRIWFVEWWNGGSTDYSNNIRVPIGMDTGVTRRVKISLDGRNYIVWLDGVQILDGVFDEGAPTDTGFFGINMQGLNGTNWNSRAIIDNIRVSSVDFTELRALYSEMSAKGNTGYTAATWESFQTKLNEIKALLDAGTATQAQVDAAKTELQSAFDALEPDATFVKPTSVVVRKDGTVVNEHTILKVYTNNDHPELGHTHNHSLTLTAEVLPTNASNKNVNWIRKTAEGKVALSRDGNTLTVTAIHNEAETNVGPVELNIVAEADDNVRQTFTVEVYRILENDVSISIRGVNDPNAAPKFGQTLEADINQLKMNDAGKAALTYQWTRTKDGNSQIIGGNSKTYTLTEDDIGATFSVSVTADPSTYYEGTRSATRSQPVEKADGPNIPGSTIYGVKTTTPANSDGKIVGFGANYALYEYKANDAATWTDVTGVEVTGLQSGEYQVRIKETATHKAGTAIHVTVAPYNSNYKMINIAADMVNGTVTRSVGQADPDTRITLTIRPDTGYKLDSLTVTGASGAPVETLIKGDDITEDGKTYETYLFIMPDEDVTVSATFSKLRLTIQHELTHLTCSRGSGSDKHEVEYGETAAITLVPEEGYALPAGEAIEITNADGVKITGWTIDRNGTITITGGVTSNLTIKAAGVVRTYVVNYTLTRGLSAPEADAPRQVAYKAAYTGTLVAASGYMLPDSITVTMNGEKFTDFTYENGTLTIPAGKIEGNLVITASGAIDDGGSSGDGETTLPPTSTEEKENPDGSTTTVVTDNKTGTVTETTEKPDGTKVIVETKKDGTVTETTEKPDGSKEIVETKKDGTVTETKTDTEGGEVAKVTDPDKNVEIKVTDPSGEVLAEVKLPAEIPAPEKRFVDVPETHWADEAIHEMAGLGVVNGVGNDRFDMNSSLKRGDLALLLARMSNAKEDYELTFTDVPAGKYYANGVAWAAKSGVVTGRSADKFDPEATITRGELAVMLYRYAKLLKLDTSVGAGALDAFKDGSASPDWAVDGLAWCVENGILKGKGGGILDSAATTTRAEVAVMLQRFVNLMK